MSRRVLLLAAIGALAALPLTFGTFWINMVITALIFSLAVFSVNLLTDAHIRIRIATTVL